MSAGKIILRDCTANGNCAKGVRLWFRGHGLDYQDFVKNGIDIEPIEALNDHFGNAVAKRARERIARESA